MATSLGGWFNASLTQKCLQGVWGLHTMFILKLATVNVLVLSHVALLECSKTLVNCESC